MDRFISVRLDEDALRALRRLGSSGLTRSEVIRKALVDASERMEATHAVAAEAAGLEADETDRVEMLEIADLMASLRASV